MIVNTLAFEISMTIRRVGTARTSCGISGFGGALDDDVLAELI